MESSRINMNISNVNINQEILFSKEVDVAYEFNGTPEEGYALTGEVISDCDSVLICGRKGVVENVNRITVRGDALNVDGLRTNLTVQVDLNDYLPAGVELAEKGFDGVVTATGLIRKETYTILTKDISEIRFVGLPEGKAGEILEEGDFIQDGKLIVRIYGLSELIGEVDEKTLIVSIDIDAYERQHEYEEIPSGIYTMVPQMVLPDGVRMEEGCSVRVRVFDEQ